MNYDVVIGIEIHCELKTKTKMFSGAPTSFGMKANTCVNEIDLGHPGTLPAVNKQAVRYAIMACTALNMSVDTLVKFDRKNYYYTDLPKGFQITQQFHPIGSDGYLDIETEAGTKRIGVERLHMEEDTAKQFHLDALTLVDYNRAGTPLVEIVSKPDMTSGKEAAAYVSKLRETLFYLGVSDVKMEEGSMRCDVNISLKPAGSPIYGTKVEIKNLNSISNVQKAVDFEIERQSKIYDEGGKIAQETRRFDEATQTTVSMRLKEGAVDYKYFPEPNIFPIQLDPQWVKNIQENLPELPDQRRARYMNEYGLGSYDANVLISNKELSDFYEEVCKIAKDGKIAANWCISELSGALSKRNETLSTMKMTAAHLGALINMILDKEISGKQAKEVFEDVLEGKDPKEVAAAKGMKQVSDTSAILALINQVLDENPQSIEDFKNGKSRAVGFLVGQVMKKSKGQANPAMTNQLLNEELKKR